MVLIASYSHPRQLRYTSWKNGPENQAGAGDFHTFHTWKTLTYSNDRQKRKEWRGLSTSSMVYVFVIFCLSCLRHALVFNMFNKVSPLWTNQLLPPGNFTVAMVAESSSSMSHGPPWFCQLLDGGRAHPTSGFPWSWGYPPTKSML